MKRFNYLQETPGRSIRRFFGLLPYFETSKRMQQAFLSCAITAVLCSALSLWANTELRLSQARYVRSVFRLEHAEAQIAQLKTVTTTIERLGENARQVGDVRGHTAQRLKSIAEIGDHLSSRIWLLALHEDGKSIHVRGRALTATDVGAALASLQKLTGLGQPRLDDVHSASMPSTGLVEFDLVLDEQAR